MSRPSRSPSTQFQKKQIYIFRDHKELYTRVTSEAQRHIALELQDPSMLKYVLWL